MFVICKDCLSVPNITVLYTALQFDTDCQDLSEFVDMLQDFCDEKSYYIRPLDSDIDSNNITTMIMSILSRSIFIFTLCVHYFSFYSNNLKIW